MIKINDCEDLICIICEKKIVKEEQGWYTKGGMLQASFGYGSEFDTLTNFGSTSVYVTGICDNCFE